jgi:O-antigen ligase
MIFFYILVFAAPMPNHPLFEAPVAGLTVVKWLGIVACFCALLSAIARRGVPVFTKSLEARAFLVLVYIASLSWVMFPTKGTITFSPMSSYISFVLLFLVTPLLVDRWERLHNTLVASIAGVALASLYVIREFQSSGGTNLRPGYIAGDSNYFAASALLVLPISVYFARGKGSRWERGFCIASLAVILIAFTLASSRGGLLGLCVELAYMILRSGKSRGAAIMISLVLLPLFMLSPASPLTRMLHPAFGDELGKQIRVDFWREGMEIMQAHPLTGVGLGNFTAYSYSGSLGAKGMKGMACNTFLETTAELGFPGLLAYCAVLVGAFISAGKLRAEGKRRKQTRLFYTGEGIQAGVLGFATAALFVSAQYQKPFWIIVALTATIPTLPMKEARQLSRGSQQAAMTGAPNYASTKA